MDFHHERHLGDGDDRGDIANEVELQVLEQACVDGVHRSAQEQGVPVRSGFHDLGSGIVATGAGPVLNNNLLAEMVRQHRGDGSRNDVQRTTGRKADDQANRQRWVSLLVDQLPLAVVR